MLKDAQAISTIPCKNIQNSRQFYEGTLGLQATMEDQNGVTYVCGNNSALYLYQTMATGGEATRVTFLTNNFDTEVSQLQSKGVVLEDYELSTIQQTASDTMSMTKTAPGIFSDPTYGKACWFKDPDGNILNLGEMDIMTKRAAA